MESSAPGPQQVDPAQVGILDSNSDDTSRFTPASPPSLPRDDGHAIAVITRSRRHSVIAQVRKVESDAKENCVSLIIRTGMLLKIDHTAVVTAVSFLHRFYAEHSVFKNDRFAISMACLYLGGKVADSPKSSRDVLMAGFSVLYPKVRPTKEWLDAARKKLVRAERVVLYQTGFKFASKTANQHMLDLLQERQLNSFLTSTLKGDAVKFFNLSNALVRACCWVECRVLCGALSRDGGRSDDGGRSQTPLLLVPLSHSFPSLTRSRCQVNSSAKIPLIVEYHPKTIAAACVWFAMKLFKLPDGALNQPRPWYAQFATAEDLKDISERLSSTLSEKAGLVHWEEAPTAVGSGANLPPKQQPPAAGGTA